MARQRKRKGDPVHGWLNIDKPRDITSTQVVGICKRLFNAQKVGHAGTLDPLADGVLPLAFGEATKTVAYAMDADKTYEFTIRWGASTDSQDTEGEVIATSGVRPDRAAIEAALEVFVGEIEQIPPKYSAIKVDGERAYDLARDGEEFELKGRPVEVFEAELLDVPDIDHTVIRIDSGKGFYVRALVRDLAAALGTEGHVVALHRTRVGPFERSRGVPLARLEEMAEAGEDIAKLLLPVEMALEDIPVVEIGGEDAFRLRQGREIVLLPHVAEALRDERRALEAEGVETDRLALARHGKDAVALGEVRAGRFQPSRVFQL